ncbi:hypothetical protein [Streptomyces sp. NBC_01589]|uniref:hypothetical protein n=1 Tax=Streptomyces sp. NBC_01589 TaxID=2975886 RepID=UPI00386A4E6B
MYFGRDGRQLMDAAVLLGAEIGGVPVTPGRWKIRLRFRNGIVSRRMPLLLMTPPTPYDGPTGPMAVSPVTGHRHRIGRTLTGNVRIVCSAAEPAVEVVDVHIGHSGIQVDFRTLGMTVADPWCEFIASGRRIQRPLLDMEGGMWRVDAPLAEMKPKGRRREHWDVLLCSEGHRSVRVARRLHDVRSPQRVFAMRKIMVAPQPENLIMVEPRYTAAGNLRFTCSPVAE